MYAYISINSDTLKIAHDSMISIMALLPVI